MITSALYAYDASLDHAHAIIYVLDDLEGDVDMGGFGEGFHEGIVPLMTVVYLEYILCLNDCHYRRMGMRGLCLRARFCPSMENACKSCGILTVHCMLCSAAVL